jgi:DNA polymerase V
VRRRWSVVLERTVRELQGMQCIDLDDAPAPKKEIACTRSFGHAVTELPPLVEAVSEFASRAAEKLRKQGSLASQLLVFCHTSPFRPGPRFNRSIVVPLRRPTADTGKLVWAASAGMRRIYEPGFKMAKAGVMLLDLVPGSVLQGELDLEDEDHRDRTRLMEALDTLNQRYGKGTVHAGATGGTNKGKDWGMKQERRTPQYTTRWEDVPIARA